MASSPLGLQQMAVAMSLLPGSAWAASAGGFGVSSSWLLVLAPLLLSECNTPGP